MEFPTEIISKRYFAAVIFSVLVCLGFIAAPLVYADVTTTAPVKTEAPIPTLANVLDSTAAFFSTNSAPARVQVSAYAGDDNSEKGLFTTDFIVPLYYPQDKNTLVFYNPKYTYTDPEANEVNQGLGIRHIFDDSFILGANAFFDRRESDTSNWFSQAGVGFEYLSHPLDMRLNWYKPTTGAKEAGEPTYGFGSTSLIEYENKEEPMQGEDFEIGVPILDKYTRTRLYLGGYFYQSQLGPGMNGFRARTETSLTHWLSIDTVFNSNINNRTEIYGGLRISIPFDLADIFDRKNRKESVIASEAKQSPNAYLEDRIFDRVVRDIDIQSKTSAVASTAHNMVYVNDANTGTQNGTLQNPYATLSAGIAAASGSGKWVYVEQGNASYVGNFTLPSGVTLWGSGYNGGFNGLNVSGVYPVIDGGAAGNVITLNGNNTVMGLQIQNSGASGTDAGVYASNVSNGTIQYNYILNNYEGVYIGATNANVSGFNVSNNTIKNNGDNGIWSNNTSNSGGSYTTSNFTVSGNTSINNGGTTITGCTLLVSPSTTTGSSLTVSNFTVTGNTSSGNDYGLEVEPGSSTGTETVSNFTVTGNAFSDHGRSTSKEFFLRDYITGGSLTYSNFTIAENILDNTFKAIYFDMGPSAGTSLLTNFTFTGNTINNNAVGISNSISVVGSASLALSNITFTENTLNNSPVALVYNNAGTGTVTMTNEKFSYNTFNASSVNPSGNAANYNFGNGTTGGHNSFINGSDLNNGSSQVLSAEYNWWGQATGPAAGQITGSVDTANYLASDPN